MASEFGLGITPWSPLAGGALSGGGLPQREDLAVVDELEVIAKAHETNVASVALARLNAITEPAFGFPQSMLTMALGITNGETTINVVSAPISEYVMLEGRQPY